MRKSIFTGLAALAAALGAALALGSCSEPPPVERIAWQPDGNGYVQFRTNDESDYDTTFFSIPSDAGNVLTGGANWTAQADVMQVSGTTVGGHGLVVGYDGIDTPTNNCVFLFITCTRQFIVMKRENGVISPLMTGWGSDSNINTYKQVNTLKATYDHAASRLTFYANGHELWHLNDYSIVENTQAGFCNYIFSYDYEGFPNHHSDRRFKLTLPVVYPAP